MWTPAKLWQLGHCFQAGTHSTLTQKQNYKLLFPLNQMELFHDKSKLDTKCQREEERRCGKGVRATWKEQTIMIQAFSSGLPLPLERHLLNTCFKHCTHMDPLYTHGSPNTNYPSPTKCLKTPIPKLSITHQTTQNTNPSKEN